MDLAKLMPKFEKPKNVFDAVAKMSDAVKSAKEIALDCKRVKDFVLGYNSKADEEYEKVNPVPPANSPDWEQIVYYSNRAFSLSMELIGVTGEKAKKEFSEPSE